MNITVIGTGYVGLVSGVCFAEFGFDVTCVDNNLAKVESLKKGEVPIYEPGLDKLMKKNMEAGRLGFSSSTKDSVKDADIIFIAVGTPSKEDGSANLDYVYSAVAELAGSVNPDAVLVIKSTVPVGTTKSVKKFLKDRGVEIDVAFNPEFLKEGAAIDDFMHPDRVILGVESKKAKKVLSQVYRPLYVFNVPIVFTNLETAELSKYSSNAFLAMKVTFINEIANLCEACGADVNDVALAMGLDKRIGDKFLLAGPGYGGSCFPKDTSALADFAKDFGVNMNLVEETISSNDKRRAKMVKKILSACDGDVKGKDISVLGVTFKANTDDMRDSPSIEIIQALQNAGANIKVYDPSFSQQAKRIFNNVSWEKNPYECCNDADVVLILTDWSEFRALNLKELRKRVKSPLLIDLRNIYSVDEVKASGFSYCSVGRVFCK
ncbi:MAG: UDP-glucose/GDP-mannose dehydrogenase family protein [Alphaproteobacteria bacterium]|nr:UDP-glucose/GDP-mannose dehydrogenase family protein [Alphaproteobacteria bacterium]MBO7537358.1 UDP-glucose/GDP-mannose dehydrogenase family protein [Alphaproteobacteria bacterium]MBO7641730.1 UDP-glucose/GDP-mannose dehydrogenase family protein [Alphaproteobacteria bacterium]